MVKKDRRNPQQDMYFQNESTTFERATNERATKERRDKIA
jgi:hypothetical protein